MIKRLTFLTKEQAIELFNSNNEKFKEIALSCYEEKELKVNNFYYGIKFIDGNYDKGFISRENYDRDSYKIMALDKITNGNTYYYYKKDSLTDLIDKLKSDKHEVYIFTTYQELFKWLAE